MPPLLADIFHGRRDVVWRAPGGELVESPPEPPAGLLSGSFDPLHVGHQELRDVAEGILQAPVAYELPVVNADKPMLEPDELLVRIQQFDRHPLALTGAATFVEKARIFPGVTFIVGVDTAERILQPRFYVGSKHRMAAALAEIQAAGSQFLVAGREMTGEFHTVEKLDIPAEFHAIFTEISYTLFRRDISSTEIRERPPWE